MPLYKVFLTGDRNDPAWVEARNIMDAMKLGQKAKKKEWSDPPYPGEEHLIVTDVEQLFEGEIIR